MALRNYLNEHEGLQGIFAETAHPVKFYDVVEPLINKTIPLPDAVSAIIDKIKVAQKMEVNYDDLKQYLLTLK